MRLPEDDEEYLREKGFEWELIPNGNGACLIIQKYPLSKDRYDRAECDVMIRVPAQYPNAKLDMYYVDPPIKLKTGAYPHKADNFEGHAGRRWQRFSRHIPNGEWLDGEDGLLTLLRFIRKELQGGE